MHICFFCKNAHPEGPKKISFTYNGIYFSIFKSGLECTKCIKKETIKRFKKLGKQFISKKEKIEIDWNFYFSFFTHNEQYNQERQNQLNKILLDIGLLSYSPIDHWQITDGALNLNPSRVSGILYFVREEDARQYAAHEYSGTMYSWWIQHIDKIINKKDIKS